MVVRQDARISHAESNAFLLSTAWPDSTQKRLAGGVLAAFVVVLLVTIPFSRIQPKGTEILLPAYAAAVLIVELLTSALLMALATVQNSRAVLTLSTGYLFSGLLVIPWVATLPDVFTALGVNGSIQSTAVIAATRRLGFPLFVIAYACTKEQDAKVGVPPRASMRLVILCRVALIVGIAFGMGALAMLEPDELPKFMKDTRNVAPLWQYVPAAAVCLYLVGLGLLWARRRSTLDLWLLVVLVALLIENVMLTYVTGGTRLNVAWWAGRLFGLASASMVLVVLLSNTMTLQARLASSIHAERLARESRLSAMEALSASVAHEINQPLTGIVTNANVGLRWLERGAPGITEAQAVLKEIVDDGHRAADMVDGIRKLFNKDAQHRVPIDLNGVIEGVLQRLRNEPGFDGVSITADLQDGLPPITGNPLQLQQVMSNLVGNAAEAMRTLLDRPRVVRVTSGRRKAGDILVSVEDTGPGIDPELRDRIFEPFFTTKQQGMGMGLMFSRTIIENHGGRLWVSDTAGHGAVFHFTLPASDVRGQEVAQEMQDRANASPTIRPD